MWDVVETETFQKWRKKAGIEDEQFEFLLEAFKEFRNVDLGHEVQSCLFRTERYQCWRQRLPDIVRKTGKSGGFRAIFVLDLEDKKLLLQGIFRRNHLDFKGSSGKYQHQHDSLLEELVKGLI
jgi:hypothetical protein